MVENNELLQNRLIVDLIQYQKDIETANIFLKTFGYEKHLKNLPESMRDFFINNIEILNSLNPNENKSFNYLAQSEKYYYPEDLLPIEKIKFISEEKQMVEMLEYFKRTHQSLIGLDCEWKYVNYENISLKKEN